MHRSLRTLLACLVPLGALELAACCGDTDALLKVHVVDGDTGGALAMPVVSSDGDTLGCADDNNVFFSAPGSIDDGGTFVGPPGGDAGVPPPPKTHWCETWAGYVAAGQRTVKVVASGYFPTEVQVDLGSEGSSLACPSPTDAEITVALYPRPQ